ncbi:hypothetical protein [Burkholderia orbicola]|uniref:hypothetical protein n=1 Tax=Burkholderia orbicola TaxID=2978683 RepID=UPI00190899AF|nr:hypothetical protein [Burkholderia orbicola]MBK1818688.1 hypothetical protein [Burkholderia orbicola]
MNVIDAGRTITICVVASFKDENRSNARDCLKVRIRMPIWQMRMSRIGDSGRLIYCTAKFADAESSRYISVFTDAVHPVSLRKVKKRRRKTCRIVISDSLSGSKKYIFLDP